MWEKKESKTKLNYEIYERYFDLDAEDKRETQKQDEMAGLISDPPISSTGCLHI